MRGYLILAFICSLLQATVGAAWWVQLTGEAANTPAIVIMPHIIGAELVFLLGMLEAAVAAGALFVELGKVVPYGVHDIAANAGCVSVGTHSSSRIGSPIVAGSSNWRRSSTIPAVRSGFVIRWKWRISAVSFNFLAG